MNKKYKPFRKTKLEQNVELFKDVIGIQVNQINEKIIYLKMNVKN